MKPQLQTIVKHLQTVGSISSLEAITQYNIMSLSRRINDLEELGYKFNKVLKAHPVTRQRYKRYHLISETNNAA